MERVLRKGVAWKHFFRWIPWLWISLMPVLADPTVSYVSMDFFEGGSSRPSTPELKRIFKEGETRTVWTRLQVDNLRYLEEANPVEFRLLYYGPENAFLGEARVEFTLPSGWEAAYLYAGWGWAEPGRWETGIHRVEAYSYDPAEPTNDYEPGYTLFRTEFFSVERAPASAYLAPDPDFSLQGARHFEGGREAPSGREYRKTFPISRSRSIWTEVNLINHRFGESPLPYEIDLEYYGPEGAFLGTARIDWEAPKEWARIRAVSGWGWEDAKTSTWTPGEHRVEIKSGPFLLGESYFTMEDDRPISLDYAVRDIRIFREEGSGKGAGKPTYARVFEAGSGSELQAEFTVVNPNFGIREHATELRLELSRVRGRDRTILRTEALPVAFDADTEKRVIRVPLGVDSAGRRGAGHYGVQIFLGERLLNLGYFRVAGRESDEMLPPENEGEAEAPVGFRRLAFFEGPKEFIAPEASDYRARFVSGETRYIWVDIFLENLRVGQGDFELPLTIRYIRPDGSILADLDKTFSIQSEMNQPITSTGYGFGEVGQWDAGEWKVEIFYGNDPIGSGSFEILP